MLKIECVSGRSEPEVLAEFTASMVRCYARYGAGAAAKVVTPSRPNVHLITIRDREARLRAGIRILPREPGFPLPIEDATGRHPILLDKLSRYQSSGVAEVSGLWSDGSDELAGIGSRAVSAAVAVAPSLGLATMVAFGHQHHKFGVRIGFVIDEDIGELSYPDPRYRSTVYWCQTDILATAEEELRQETLAFRQAIGTHGYVCTPSAPSGHHDRAAGGGR
jgi:hypothetical protein